MDNLHRELAPVSEAAWTQIEEEATRTLKRHLAGRRVVDVQGPASFGPVPTSDVSLSSAQGAMTWGPLPTSATQIISSGSASATGGDSYTFGGFYLNTVPNVTPGTYPGEIQFILLGN